MCVNNGQSGVKECVMVYTKYSPQIWDCMHLKCCKSSLNVHPRFSICIFTHSEFWDNFTFKIWGSNKVKGCTMHLILERSENLINQKHYSNQNGYFFKFRKGAKVEKSLPTRQGQHWAWVLTEQTVTSKQYHFFLNENMSYPQTSLN